MIILRPGEILCLTPAPGAGTVGYEESKEAPYKQAFHNLSGRDTLHKPSFGKIEKEKSDNSTHQDGAYSRPEAGRAYCPV